MTKKQCTECGTTKFGLIRHRYGFKHQFCSKRCKEKFLAKLAQERERVRQWLGFLARSPT